VGCPALQVITLSVRRVSVGCPALQVIRLTFSEFDVELSENCVYDHLSVFDGDDDQSPTVGVYCGKRMPQELIQSTGSTLFLAFVSDAEDGGNGFVVDWQAVDNVGQ